MAKKVEAELILKAIEDNAWDLICENSPIADTGDYSIQWVVYEHYQGSESKPIGFGNSPIEAVKDAEIMIHGTIDSLCEK